MKLEDLKRDLEKHDLIYHGLCHDCGISVSVSLRIAEEGNICIEGGSVYKVKQMLDDTFFLKCDNCYANDNVLRNYQECEVYSRVVGYLRPLNQWNKGKKAEYGQRKEFQNIAQVGVLENTKNVQKQTNI